MSDLVEVAVGQRPGDRPRRLLLPRLAARQHGVVSRPQLRELGLSEGAIKRLVAEGHLVRLHRGVYAVGHDRLSVRGRWMAAVLACGEGAVLSHRAAAALWDLVPSAGARPEVTAPRTRSRRTGIVVHLSRRMDPADRAVRDGIPVTSVHRTLLDLAEVVHPNRLENALEAAERLRLLDVTELRTTMERSPGRQALNPLAAWVAETHDAPAETKSELERRFRRFLKDRDLPLPSTNVTVAGYEVDCFWPDRKLVIELDSWEFHKTQAAFERDRARDADLELAGYRARRLTSRLLTAKPDAIERLIRG